MARVSDPDIDARMRRIERKTGKPVILRAVRPGCPCFRGRVTELSKYFLVEYRDETAGFFWDHDLIRELLTCIEERRGQRITLYDGDVQYLEIPTRSRFGRTSRDPRPPNCSR